MRFRPNRISSGRACSAKSLACFFQVARKLLPRTRAAGRPADRALPLHRGKFNRGAVGEMIKHLLGAAPPGMMLAHERAGGVHHPLIVRIAAIRVEAVGEVRTAEADRNRQWREVGVGAQILRDLGISSIVNLTSSVHDYKGLSGFGIEIVGNERLDV